MLKKQDAADIGNKLASSFKKVETMEKLYFTELNKTLKEFEANEKRIKTGIEIWVCVSEAEEKNCGKFSSATLDKLKLDLRKIDSSIDKSISFQLNDEGEMYYGIINNDDKESEFLNPERLNNYLIELNSKIELLNTILLTSLISVFEGFLSLVYERIIRNNPLPYFENATINISTIIEKDLKTIVDREIEKLVTKDMMNPFDVVWKIEKKEKIPLIADNELLDRVKDINLERNLFAHNSGLIDSKFIVEVSNKKPEYKTGAKLKIFPNDAYERITIIYKALFLIYYNTADNLCDNSSKLLESVENIAFELLKSKEYKITEYIYKKLSSNDKFEFADKLLNRINYLISLKELKKVKILNEELERLDVSATEERFKIAKKCLENKNEDVYNDLQRTYPDVFDASMIKEWPLFIGFRKSNYYDQFKAIHPEDFLLQKYDKEIDEIKQPMFSLRDDN